MRKTQYAWMFLGGLICLFGLVLACKLGDGNRAVAQPELLPPPTPVKKEPAPSLFTLPPTISTSMKEPELLPPPKKAEKLKELAQKDKPSGPKATLGMPMPSELSQGLSPVLPAAFSPNTPTPPVSGPLPAKAPSPKPVPAPLPVKAPGPKPASPSQPPTPLPPPSSTFLPYGYEKKKMERSSPGWNAPAKVVPPSAPAPVVDQVGATMQPGEPPLAPAPGPVQLYHVHGSETLQDIARRTLGSMDRLHDVQKLNPTLEPDKPLRSGLAIRLPADACLQADDAEPVKPLPVLHSKPPAPKAKVLPLTGTYQCSLDEKNQLTLPRAIRDQLGGSATVLLSPGPDKCLWLTDQPHLERLGERLDQSQANEADVRVFKRLYFAQTEKLTVNSDGRVTVPERLGQFAGLHQEVVLVGIDDHFEVWDAARWRSYTQQKSAGHAAAVAEQE